MISIVEKLHNKYTIISLPGCYLSFIMRIHTVLLAIVLLPVFSVLAVGNPVSRFDPSEGVFPMYLKEETIIASIRNGTAIVRAEYVLECFELTSSGRDGKVGFAIVLPFWDPFFNLTVEIDGWNTRHTKGIYLYDPLDGSPRRTLPCVDVSVPGDWSARIVRMNATYECCTTEKTIDNRTVFELSYLVGSAQYWNKSIDRASFEFTVLDDGNISALNGWNKTIADNKTIFTREYTDWTPEFDLMTLSWVEFESTPIKNEIDNEKDEEGSSMGLWTILLIVAIVFIVVMASIFVIGRRSNKIKS